MSFRQRSSEASRLRWLARVLSRDDIERVKWLRAEARQFPRDFRRPLDVLALKRWHRRFSIVQGDFITAFFITLLDGCLQI